MRNLLDLLIDMKPVSIAHNIDCMEYMKSFPDKYFDLVCSDPPYGIREDGHRHNNRSKLTKTKNYHKALWDQDRPTKEYFNEIKRVSKNQIVWGGNHLADLIGEKSPCWIVWDKINGDTNFADCELAYTSFKGAVRKFDFMWNGMLQGDPKNGKKMNPIKANNQQRIHPTEKPIPLYKWIFENYSAPGQKILDTHAGSQSARIAAYELGIDFYCCEIDPVYFSDGNSRFQDFKKNMDEIKQFGYAKTHINKIHPTLF